MKRGKMLKSFTITLLAVGLLVGCSKRTDQPSDSKLKNADVINEQTVKKVKVDPADVAVDYTATNPKGGVHSDVLTVLTAEEQETRIVENARAPIVLGVGAGNITFESSIAVGVEILSRPYYSGSEENPLAWAYNEGLFIRWGSDPAQGSLVQSISIDEDYKGGFEVPGFGTIHVGDEFAAVNANVELQSEYITTIYKTYVDPTVENCLDGNRCFPYDKDGMKLWVIAQEVYGVNGHIYIYFDDDFNKITNIYMTTANPEWDKLALANSRKPILLPVGAAGINFNMTKEEAVALLTEPENKDEAKSTYTYGEKIIITWGVNAEEGNKPQMIRAFSGYQGTFNIPTIGDVQLGQDLSEYLATPDAFFELARLLYNQTYSKEEGYSCLQTQECGWYNEEQTIFVFVQNGAINVAFFLGADKKSITEVLMLTATPETEVAAPAEEPTAAPAQGGQTEQPTQGGQTEQPAQGGQTVQPVGQAIELFASTLGVTWSTTKEEASQLLTELTTPYEYSVYEGGIIIDWLTTEATSTAALIYLQGDYQGTFTLPGYAPIGIGTPVSNFIDLTSEAAVQASLTAFANAAYAATFPGTPAGYNCFTEQTCGFTQASNGYYELYLGQSVRIDFDPNFTVLAGIMMFSPNLPTEGPAVAEEEPVVVEEEPVVVEEEPVVTQPIAVPDYAKAPIIIGTSVAGITFDTLETEATLLEQVPADFGDPTIKLYNGGLIVQWGADSKPMAMVVFAGNGGYEGKATVPGYGELGLGDSIGALIGTPVTPEIFQVIANTLYAEAYGPVAEGYNCAQEQTCGLGADSTGAPVLFLGAEGRIQISFTPDMDRITQLVMISPSMPLGPSK